MENKKDKITEVSEKKEDAAAQESCCCQCSHKTKERSEKEYRDLMNRLKRIGEGHSGHAGEGCVLYGYSGAGGGGKCSAQQL